MKKIVFGISLIVFLTILAYWAISSSGSEIFNPKGDVARRQELPYEKYSFGRLVERKTAVSKIELGREFEVYPEYVSSIFYYTSEGRRISGQINIPNLSRMMGVVVMARGYVEKDGYKTGTGTKNAAAVYAKNGYITMAPDFSGYGESDPDDDNALGARLSKPVEILDLIASLPSLPQVDLSKIYLWGHSNGGQIMLSVAEIIGKSGHFNVETFKVIGVTLWAPVSKPFPYNILYYTDDASDSGKWLRGQVAQFEKDYDVFDYSIDRYFDWINIPIQIHQGTADESVPKTWSDVLAKSLKDHEKTVTYWTYPGADHNMRPGWDTVVVRDVEWFNQLTKEAP